MACSRLSKSVFTFSTRLKKKCNQCVSVDWFFFHESVTLIELSTAKLYANLENVILVRPKCIFAEVMTLVDRYNRCFSVDLWLLVIRRFEIGSLRVKKPL